MFTRSIILSCVLFAAACASDPDRSSHHGFVVDDIRREVTFEQPIPARLFVDYRAVSYVGHTIEYGIEVDDMPLVVTYTIDPASPRPLQTRIYDGVSLDPVLSLLADDRTLDIAGADETHIVVDSYTDPAAAIARGDVMSLPLHLRPLLDAVLPARSELAPVPSFWQNIDQPQPADNGDIGQTSSSGRPLLESWAAPVSLLGSLFLQSPCVVASAGYRCPCMHVQTPAVGEVETCTTPTLPREPALNLRIGPAFAAKPGG